MNEVTSNSAQTHLPHDPIPEADGNKACPRCQNIVESWARICPRCEYEWAEPSFNAQGEAQELEPFSALMKRYTPRVWATPALIGLNGLVFLAMIASGISIFSPTTDNLLRWGADYAPRVSSGQWWRLFTSMFLHIGIIHILFNMLVLWDIGRFVERLLGNLGFLGVYLVSGLAGSVVSIWWNPMQVSAGASGAIFGLYGFLFGYLLRHRSSIPPEELRKLVKGALIFVGYNLVYGASMKGVDMAAHLGGLFGGFALGLGISQSLTEAGIAVRTRLALMGSGVGMILLLGCVWSLPKTPDLQVELARFEQVEARSVEHFNAAVGRSHAHQIDDHQFANVIETEVLPEWRQCREHLEQLQGLPKPQAEFMSKLCAYMAVREESWTVLDAALSGHDTHLAGEAHQRQLEAERLLAELKEKG